MYRIKSKLLNETITILNKSDSSFFSQDKVSLEVTEIDELLNKRENISEKNLKNIFLLKKHFEGQILNFDICPICKCNAMKELVEIGNENVVLMFEIYTEEVHKCK